MQKFQVCALLTVCLATPAPLLADFSYQQTTQITGGSMLSMLKMAGAFSAQARQANQPTTTSIYLKGNRMARVSTLSTEIIDLDQETITHIDMTKHTYTVITFQQMKEQVEAAESEMKKKQADAPADTSKPDNDVQMSFDVHVRKTGAEKQVSGLTANEAILTMVMKATDTSSAQSGTMAVTNDMWLVPEIPGYAEMKDFDVRMAAKMGTIFSGGGFDMTKMFRQQPGAGEAMKGLATEMQQIQGVPVLQVMRMGTTSDGKPLPAASEAPAAAGSGSSANGDSGQPAPSIASRLGALGGFGGFGHKKQADPDQDAQPANNGQQPTSAVLIESQTETSAFSSLPVDDSHFSIPPGLKQIPFDVRRSN